MKIYKRNNKGQYVKATRIPWLILLTILCILCGMIYSIVVARPLIAGSDTEEAPKTSYTVVCGQMAQGYACDDIEALKAHIEAHKATRTMTVIRTKYSRADSCHNKRGNECLTAIGRDTLEGQTVACPRSLKLGTRIRMEGHVYTCEDRYAAFLDTKRPYPTIDVFAEAENVKNLPAYKVVTIEIL